MLQRSLFSCGVSRPNKRKQSDTESEIVSENPSKKLVTKVREFQSVWITQFSWLEYNSELNRIFCKTCRAAGIKNCFTKEGAGNLQRSTLVKHNESKEHKQGLEAHHLRIQLYSTSLNPQTSETDAESIPPVGVSESEQHLFRTVHFCALENMPNSMVNSQLDFLRASGVDPKVKDIHASTVKDVQQSLLYVLDQQLKEQIKDCGHYGIIIDESTDLAVHKKLVVYIRYVHSGEVKMELIGNIRIVDGRADTIAEEVRHQLASFGLDIQRLVGLGSDGASVMFGRKGGVGVLLGKDAPLLVHVHCVAHRLALACSDAAKDIPYLKQYKDTLKNLYIHVTGSGIRVKKLEELQAVMDEPQLRLKDPISIRWLAMEGAVKTIHKCYGAIVMYLQSNEGKNTVGDNVAEGLLKDVLHYKFPAFTAVLADVLSVIGILCRQLQEEKLDLSQFTPMKDGTVGKLRGLQEMDGDHVQEFSECLTTNGTKVYYKGIQMTHTHEKQQVEKLKVNFIDSVVDSLESRLATDKASVLSAFEVFEPVAAEVVLDTAQQLETLANHYNVDAVRLKLEYSGVKALLSGSYRNLKFQEFSRMLMLRHNIEYPLTVKVCTMGLCIPVSSVACERGFSLQNRIKVKSRTTLTPENLYVLMRLSTGPSLADFKYAEAVRHWRLEKKRRLARLYQPKKV